MLLLVSKTSTNDSINSLYLEIFVFIQLDSVRFSNNVYWISASVFHKQRVRFLRCSNFIYKKMHSFLTNFFYFKCNKILTLSDQYKLQVSNYVFQVLHSNIDEEIKSSLHINNQIHSHNTRTNNQMSILRVNRSKTKHCVLHNGMITWNSLPDMFKVNVSFQCPRAWYEIFICKKIRKYWCWAPLWLHFLFWHACNCGFSSVTLFGFEYYAVKFPIILLWL